MKVSVIVPTYNQCQYLKTCLDSLWFQDFEGGLEIVLVNDGSTDSTREVIESFSHDLSVNKVSYASHYNQSENIVERIWHDRYPQENRTLVVVHHHENKGLGATLNTGIHASSGSYCTYVPSDNYCYPSMIAALIEPLQAGEYDFTYSDMNIVNDQGQVLRKFVLPNYNFKRCFADWYLCGISKLYRRELHSMYGYYNEKLLAHDYELFLRFAENGARFKHVNQTLMAVRDHDTDRTVDIHSPKNWSRLIEESKVLAIKARKKID